MQTLTDMLCKELGKDELKLNSEILSLSYADDGKSGIGNWSLFSSSNPGKHSQGLSVDAIIMTVSIVICSKRNFPYLYCFTTFSF